jgi:hypothetical protein
MVFGGFSVEDVLVIFSIYLLGAYFLADYIFSCLWRNACLESSKKLYFTKLVASTNTVTSPSVRNDVPDGSPYKEKFYGLTGKDGVFTSEQTSSRRFSGDANDAIVLLDSELNERSLPGKSRSRHGLFDDKSDDAVTFDLLNTVEKCSSDECSILANLDLSGDKLIREKDQPSPTSSGGDSQIFHFRYNTSMSHATPFSPMYNLPNISPYPTPYIRKGQHDEFVPSSASLSEDAADTPFRPCRPFGSPIMGYDQQSHRKRMDEQNVYFNEPDIQNIQELKLVTSNL